jgi:hypothetical protein
VGGQVIQGQWQHFVFRRDADGNRDIFVNGVSVANVGGAAPLEPFNGILTIGADLNGGNSFNGIIDEFVVWGRALGTDEIEALYGSGLEGTSLGDLIGGGEDRLGLQVRKSGPGMLELSWNSAGGELYNVRSETNPANGDPNTWPIFNGYQNLAAAPPRNILTFPRPADSERFFVVEAFPAPPVTVFEDDFENGVGGWTMGSEGAGGTVWELGDPGVGPFGANSPVNCFATNLDSDYGFDAIVWLRSPSIDLTTAGGATLRYAEFRDIETGFDFGTVRILDAGNNAELAVLDATIDGVTVDWEDVKKSIPAAALGKVIKIEFRFTSDDIQNYAGWYLDDILVTVP